MTWYLMTFLEGQLGVTNTPRAEGRAGVGNLVHTCMLNLAKASAQNTSKEGAQLASPYLHVELGQGLCGRGC